MKKIRLWFQQKFGENWVSRFLNSIWSDLVVFVLSLPFWFASGLGSLELVKVFCLLIGQNVSFTWVSRARQTKSLFMHKLMSVLSNGFYIFVVTAYVAYYKNTPMKAIYVAGTIIGASLGHRSSIWFESKKTFAKDAVVTRAEFDSCTQLQFDEFYKSKVFILGARIVVVYSRMLRKLRAEMNWARATFATKQELADLRNFVLAELGKLKPTPVWVPSEDFLRRTETCKKLHPKLPNSEKKIRGTRRWLKFENAGHPHLNF
ncbi:MAG: hypothetical protein KW788_00045 [Candidatus Doudnabacteria bacterium]|nr:hypothetical protein [Candidatus Doudnabacteria bacterium]